jgi:nicotinamide mononucleotide (NMN) deamidase PncC
MSKKASKTSRKPPNMVIDDFLEFEDYQSFDTLRADDILNDTKMKSHKSAHKLLVYLNNLKNKKGMIHTIGTAESLTAGLMFSTLVDIPMFGVHKYGCFGVYDTDAKRVFLGVKVKNVYTHRCAKEMAEGILKNSNATIGIAVTGNAMPWSCHKDMLGEVFIGVACYGDDKTIICETYNINMCKLNNKANTQCTLWYNNIIQELDLCKTLNKYDVDLEEQKKYNRLTDGFNDSILTAYVSSYIRNKTTEIAFDKALLFLHNNLKTSHLYVPSWIVDSIIDKPEYNEANFVGDSCQNSVLKNYRDNITNVKCINNTLCLDEQRVRPKTSATFKGGKHNKAKPKNPKPKSTKIKN